MIYRKVNILMKYDGKAKSKLEELGYLAIIILLYSSFYSYGNVIALHKFGCVITIMLVFFCCRKKYIMHKNEFYIMLMLLFFLGFWGIMQIFVIHSISQVFRISSMLVNIITVFFLAKFIGFIRYTKILRWCMFINIVLIVWTLIMGEITQDMSTKNDFSWGWFITYRCFSFPILPDSSGLGFFRCGGIFGHPNAFGMMSAIGMTGLVYQDESSWRKYLWWVLYIISFVITESRASLLLLIIFYIIKRLFVNNKNIRDIGVNMLSICIAIIISLSLATLRDDSSNPDITSGRSYLFREAMSVYNSENFIESMIGVGVGNSNKYLYMQTNREIQVDNSYIPVLIDMGLIGSGIYFCILCLMFYAAYQTHRSNLFIAYFIGTIVYSLFENVFSLNTYSFFWLMMLFSELQSDKYHGDI